MIVIVK